MRVSFEWLSEYLKIDIPVTELAERMTMAGIAVEAIEDQAAPYQGMVVAKILSLKKHEQADNLQVAAVEIGPGEVKQIITAAKNVAESDLIPLALPGTVLPDGKKIEVVSLKGVVSEGMMCSGVELGLEKEAAGIWKFGTDFNPGTPVAQALGATDRVLVLELTANRSDCLGMIGVAREVAAILGLDLKLPPITLQEAGPDINQLAGLQVEDADLCPRYAARVVSNIKIGPAPEWMQRRLKAAGVRPINNIVDITNYVMLEHNQPLHAFDLDRIAAGKVVVRRAKPGERLVTLDNVERSLDANNLLIADPQGSLCVAGVMGGATSEVTEGTTNLLLEAAYFNPLSIRRTAKALEMKTEASLRFERGINPNGTLEALNRAVQLIESFGVGTVARGYLDFYPQPVAPVRISTSSAAINGLLGTELSGTEIRGYLDRVNLKSQGNETEFTVEVPTYRGDITCMADLAEEVARLYGYNRIPVTIPVVKGLGVRSQLQRLQFDLRRLLQGNGISEVITYSLYAKETAANLGVAADSSLSSTVDLMVPLSEDQAVMRTNLVDGILKAMAFNAKRRQQDLAVYEIGRVYRPRPGAILPDEPLHLVIGLMGRQADLGWNQAKTEADFYDLKGLMELIAAKFRLPELRWERAKTAFLHPGQSAEVYCGDHQIGFLGQIHPRVLDRYELSKNVLVLEMDLTVIDSLRQPEQTFSALPKFPALERDLALVLPQAISANSIIGKIKEIGGDLVETVTLFDVYQGEQVAQGQRSLAFSLVYRSKERTLNDNEVNQLQATILQQLHQEYGAAVRV